jgi:hypothetical protein
MRKLISLTKQYPLAAFFILALTITWPMNQIMDILNPDTPLEIIVALPVALLALGPLAAALIVSALTGGRKEVVTLLRKLTVWRVSLRWYLVALLLLPALHLAAIYLNVAFGAPAPTIAAYGTVSAILGNFAFRVFFPWSAPVIEEPAWRGFAQPRMQKRYASPLAANLLLGVLVTLWHLPLILSGEYAWIYIPGTMAVTILFGWIYNATGGSVLLTLIMHAVEPLLQIRFGGADETRFMILLVVIYVVTAIVVVLFTGKNLGLKTTPEAQADLQRAVTTVA